MKRERMATDIKVLWIFFVVIALALVAIAAYNIAYGAERFPSVVQLQVALDARPGAQLPREFFANGRVWTAWYMGAKDVGGGEYDVRIKLR